MLTGRLPFDGPVGRLILGHVHETPQPPLAINPSVSGVMNAIVLRALEKKPENRYATAGDLFQELEAYLVASGARTRNHQIAQYLHDLFAKDAEVSEMGVRRARAFADDDEGDDDSLDFDKPTPGAGKALADALRSSNPFAPSAREEKAPLNPMAAHRPVPLRPADLETSELTPPRPTSGRVATPITPAAPSAAVQPTGGPRRKLGLLVGIVLASAVAVGLLLTRVHF